MIGGDLVDGIGNHRSVLTQIQTLMKEGIEVVLVAGNHDLGMIASVIGGTSVDPYKRMWGVPNNGGYLTIKEAEQEVHKTAIPAEEWRGLPLFRDFLYFSSFELLVGYCSLIIIEKNPNSL